MYSRIIKLNDKNKFSILIIEDKIFLSGADPKGASKIFLIPDFITVLKKNDDLIIDVKKNCIHISEFVISEFFQNLDFFIKIFNNLYKKVLFLNGVGYRINLLSEKKILECKIGYSHLKYLEIPESIIVKISGKKNVVQIQGSEKSELGNFVGRLINLRKPDSFKAKGFSLKYEQKKLKPVKKK
jgi:ribosomal protein L6P/L9E